MSSPASFESLGEQDFRSVLESNSRPTLFYFTDPNANLCELINPKIESICKKYAPSVDYVAIDTSQHKDLTYEFKVTRAPSFVLYFQDEEVRRLTQIEYNDKFGEKFREFLTGDFLFPTENLNTLEEENYFSKLREWYELNMVAFMMPADPINWQLARILRQTAEQYSNYLKVHLVNANSDESLLKHYQLTNLPSVLLLEETEVLRKWHPASNPIEIEETCTEFVEKQKES